MSQYTPHDLLGKWAMEEITVEQAVGQLIQIVKRLEREIAELRAARQTAAPTPPDQPGKFVTNGK